MYVKPLMQDFMMTKTHQSFYVHFFLMGSRFTLCNHLLTIILTHAHYDFLIATYIGDSLMHLNFKTQLWMVTHTQFLSSSSLRFYLSILAALSHKQQTQTTTATTTTESH